MKQRKRMLITAVVFALLTLLTQVSYANGGRGRGRDDDSHRRSRGGYYKYYHYYPKDYYYHKKIYFYPRNRYYYYYDLYPEKIYYYDYEKTAGAGNPDYVSIISIANMASQGVPDSVIISEIERTKSWYKLDAETIAYLKRNGVSDAVIDYMINTAK